MPFHWLNCFEVRLTYTSHRFATKEILSVAMTDSALYLSPGSPSTRGERSGSEPCPDFKPEK